METRRESYDVIIIGAGAVGCAIARELSRYELSVAVVERNSDVAGDTTGRNSAVVHAGFNNRPGSRMASLCVEGNEGFEELCRDLDVPYRRTGKLIAAFDDEDVQVLEHLLAQGRENGCRGLQILENEALGAFLREHGMDSMGDAAWIKALWSPRTAITNPFLYCVALAENAQANGVRFFLDTEVTGIRSMSDTEVTGIRSMSDAEVSGIRSMSDTEVTGIRSMSGDAPEGMNGGGSEDKTGGAGTRGMRFEVETVFRGSAGAPKSPESAGEAWNADAPEKLRCRYLINCAGLQADRIAAMAGAPGYRIYPCRGEYLILDKSPLAMPVYPAPRKNKGGLGVHLTPTDEGNIIIGPSAEYLAGDDLREDYACTRPVMEDLLAQAKQLMPAIGGMRVIGSYSGVRPKLAPPREGGYQDFVIRAEETVPGLIDLIGIESPGLTASVPIARRVCGIIDEMERQAAEIKPIKDTEMRGNSSGLPQKAALKNAPDGTEEDGSRCGLRQKADFCGTRQGILRFREQTPQKQAELIAEDPEYGEIICRCQSITRREIRQAIENPLGARTLSAIKYRAWATTGRCNGGYCLPRIAEIITREYGIPPEEIRYRNAGSEMFTGPVKPDR